MSAIQRLGLHEKEFAPTNPSASQAQTMQAFSYKWKKTEAYDSSVVQEDSRKWLLEKYCGGSSALLDDWLCGSRKIILDAGCGSGYSAALFFGNRLNDHDYLGIDISDAVETGRRHFAEKGLAGEFLQIPIHDFSCEPIVDIIFSEGVLHHTDSTRDSLCHLARFLRPGGRCIFYVYARKAPIREFTDDHIRNHIRDMNDDEAYDALLPLTKLGKILGDLKVSVSVPEDISFLGIKSGEYDLQRLFYYSMCKAYYREDYTIDELNLINFDWFRPLNCQRHTEEEVRDYCKEAGLRIDRLVCEESGISVVAVKTTGGLE